MKDPRFLTLDEVLAIHSDQVRQYGGSGGIRDVGLLSSALAMPRASFGGQYLHPSLHEMAAACLFHLVQNHPFIDGNERIGLAATIAFLGLNDVWLESPSEELLEMVLKVARGEIGKPETAVFLRERCVPFG
ncbi:MAG: type II toxin-antitoxin system death-on-curing family toxin [Deltaproteobacteria bacterium]|nr:MAG: type II toxin-antitoxin system death-on-curing family toxin [Deltaproteobacteria bacterium]TMB37542.1 MAG: type II toxin-antitoxin system death-on-curing family toxin [Deltaproteobacteria bacterium]